MRHRLASGIEYAQVAEVGTRHPLVHCLRQVDPEQGRGATAGERNSECEVTRHFGDRRSLQQAQQPRDRKSHHPLPFGGTGAR